MIPVQFPGTNIIYAEDQPEYLPLPAHRTPDGNCITSCWLLSPEEIAVVMETGRIYMQLYMFGNPLVPALLTVEKPDLDNPIVL